MYHFPEMTLGSCVLWTELSLSLDDVIIFVLKLGISKRVNITVNNLQNPVNSTEKETNKESLKPQNCKCCGFALIEFVHER